MEKERKFNNGDLVVFKDREVNENHQSSYYILRMVKVKRPDNGQWVDAYSYYTREAESEHIAPKQIYIRETSDMEDKFEGIWLPKLGGIYYLVNYHLGMFEVETHRYTGDGEEADIIRQFGFKEEQKAREHRDKLNEAIKNVK